MKTIVLGLNRRDRLQLATTVERLINLLDDIDGGPDLEFNLGWERGGFPYDQSLIVPRGDDADEREQENEHGGNIEDELQYSPGEYDGPGRIMGGHGL